MTIDVDASRHCVVVHHSTSTQLTGSDPFGLGWAELGLVCWSGAGLIWFMYCFALGWVCCDHVSFSSGYAAEKNYAEMQLLLTQELKYLAHMVS